MKKGTIIVNGFFKSESTEFQLNALKSEFTKRGVDISVRETGSLICYFDNKKIKSQLGETDFVVFFDKDRYISHMLEKCGYRLFNSANSIELADDKMKTFIALENSGVSFPITISSPLMYKDMEDGFLNEVEQKIGYPIVVKEVYGSMGNSVYLAKNLTELKALRKQLKLKPHLYQQFIGNGGEDIRVIVIGGKAVAWMLRKNESDFRSNLEHGGKGSKIELTPFNKSLAEKAAKALGLDYAGVDILFDEKSSYVCEVNSSAFFKGITAVSGINIAGLYADYICKAVY